MKSFVPTLLLLTGLTTAATSTTDTSLPTSTDASSFLSAEFTTYPTWATGKYATTLASALYSVATSFVDSDSYTSAIDAIGSAAEQYGGDAAAASIRASGWNWGDVTTNSWYTAHVPGDVKTAVSKYDAAWVSVYTSIEAKAMATSTSKGGAAGAMGGALPRCTGAAVAAGVVAVAVAGVL